MKFTKRGLSSEFVFKTSRSGGKGGQHVNKVSSKVELSFDVLQSALLDEEEKQIIAAKLAYRLTNQGIIKIICQEERSQFRNKQLAIEKFYALLEKCFVKRKKRIATKPSKTSIVKRLKAKKTIKKKKENRKQVRNTNAD